MYVDDMLVKGQTMDTHLANLGEINLSECMFGIGSCMFLGFMVHSEEMTKELYLYLSITSAAMSLVLIREENRIQRSAYYTNLVL